MRAGAVGAAGRAAVLVRVALVGAIARIDAGDRRTADQVDEDMRTTGELEGARDHQQPGDLNEAPHPWRKRARRGGRAVTRRSI